jgi:predicted transcriptional regulator
MPRKKPETKESIIKSRVSVALKRQVERHARSIDETESYVVRQAVRDFLRRNR